MGYENALNKKLALVLWAKDKEGEDDVAVFPGVFTQVGGSYYLQREGEGNSPEIREEWLPRIKSVPDESRDVLMGCDYQLSLSVGNSEDVNEPLENFGLKWPTKS